MQISTSFVQDQRHATKSARFVPVQPSQLATVLADHGFELGHLKTSKARNLARADHQTTIAYYRARESQDIVQALGQGSLDILVRAPHLTGAIELRLGFFRMVCANQWNAGSLLDSFKVSHTGNCLEALNHAIPRLVSQRERLVESIRAMQARTLRPAELAGLARSVADIRMAGITNVDRAHVADLLTLRREEDSRADLFSVVNVLQENAIRFGMRYEQVTGEGPALQLRNMRTRPVVEASGAAVELTGSIWEAASALLAA